MNPPSLKDRTIEDVLSQVRDSSHGNSVTSVAALTARCTIEIAGHLHDVWAGLHDVKAALVNASTEASKQSAESATHTAALVRWTKVLAWMTGAYTIITGGLLIVAIRGLGAR